MKTMIIFATTYGCTKTCAEELKDSIAGDVILKNINDAPFAYQDFENIIIGGSVYMGQIQKKLKEFCFNNINSLNGKNIGLFLCCGMPESFEQSLANAFPQELLSTAISMQNFGGELKVDKMKLGHKMITKLMQKATEKQNKPDVEISHESIRKLADTFNNL